MWSALSTQHSALSTQHSALSTQHSALSTQHSALAMLLNSICNKLKVLISTGIFFASFYAHGAGSCYAHNSGMPAGWLQSPTVAEVCSKYLDWLRSGTNGNEYTLTSSIKYYDPYEVPYGICYILGPVFGGYRANASTDLSCFCDDGTTPYFGTDNGIQRGCLKLGVNALSLTPAPNQKDPRPKGTETKDGKSTYELIAKVMEGSTPKAGVAVTFAVEVEPNTGGHDHHDASRPKGLVNGKLTASGVTEANGEIKVTFQVSQIAGTHVVAAVCESCTNKSVTKNVDVKVPDLVPFLALPFRTQQWNPAGIGQTVEHLDNHYLTVDATYRLLEIATKYKRIWPTAPTLTLNDASLKWGGKFDIDGSWDRFKGRHGEHRIGDNIDIRANSGPGTVPSNIRDAVFRWLRDESAEKDNIPEDLQILSVNPLWENPKEVNEHFHLRLGN